MRRLLPALMLALALGAGVARADGGLICLGAGASRDNLKDITSGD